MRYAPTNLWRSMVDTLGKNLTLTSQQLAQLHAHLEIAILSAMLTDRSWQTDVTLGSAFEWVYTPQGGAFWADVCNGILPRSFSTLPPFTRGL